MKSNFFLIIKHSLNNKNLIMMRVARIFLAGGFFILLFAGISNAQDAKRTSAWNYVREGNLDKAKEAIDQASVHESTVNDPKTWWIRGWVYKDIAKSNDEKYKNLAENPKEEAYNAIMKSMELDEKGANLENNKNVLIDLSTVYFNSGVYYYNEAIQLLSNPEQAEDAQAAFQKAYKDFDKFWTILAKLEREAYYVQKFLDDNGIKMSSIRMYTGFSAKQTGNLEQAKFHLGKIILLEGDEVKAREMAEPLAYIFYAEVLIEMGEFYDAIEVISRGRELWPENKDLTLTELRLYLNAGKTNELAEKLQDAIREDPANINLQATYASTLDEISQTYAKDAQKYYDEAMNISDAEEKKRLETKAKEAEKLSEEYFQKTEEAYKNAIEVCQKYKNEVKYKVRGNSSTYEITYLDENAEKRTETVISGWEYAFNANIDDKAYISALASDKKAVTELIITLAGNTVATAKDESKRSIAEVQFIVTEEALNKNDFLFDLNYNLGILYNNKGVEIYNQSLNERNPEKIKAYEKDYLYYFNKSLPYMVKADELKDGQDKNTIRVLWKIYSLQGDEQKSAEMEEKLK
jgi:thioredoxin-like negative regulator of GroEL